MSVMPLKASMILRVTEQIPTLDALPPPATPPRFISKPPKDTPPSPQLQKVFKLNTPSRRLKELCKAQQLMEGAAVGVCYRCHADIKVRTHTSTF